MSNNNKQKSEIYVNYSECLSNNKIVRHYYNGMSRFLILWIIKYYGNIHGYSVMKELDKFFSIFIDEGSLKKSNPSNIYLILNKLEEDGFIVSELKIKNNKNVKFYSITDKGLYVLNYIFKRFEISHKSPEWNILFEDFK